MNIFVTGANGFLGRHLVAEALSQGHELSALVRSKAPRDWPDLPDLRVITDDLDNAENLADLLRGSDVVIHLAATMCGKNQYASTLFSTRNLLEAMDRAKLGYLVGVSSIAVLNYVDQLPMSLINEQTPVNEDDGSMGSYALMKRDQERLFDAWAKKNDNRLALVRPGLIYDDHSLSNAHVGFVRGQNGLAVRHDGQVPLVYAKTVAKALLAIAGQNFRHEVFHLVNDDLPTQADYLRALQKTGTSGTRLVPVNWKVFAGISGFVRLVLWLIGKSGKVPDSFRENSVAGRLKPLTFSNRHAKERLDWKPCKAIYTDSGIFS